MGFFPEHLSIDNLCCCRLGKPLSMYDEACSLVTVALGCMNAFHISACMLASVHSQMLELKDTLKEGQDDPT